MSWELLFLIFCLVVFAGMSYLTMRFANRWTQKSKYAVLFNTLILIGSFFLILFIAFYIFISNVSFER
ncbi:PEP-CTERM protein-sorting domain-containing protein [Chryseobacterium flavum]